MGPGLDAGVVGPYRPQQQERSCKLPSPVTLTMGNGTKPGELRTEQQARRLALLDSVILLIVAVANLPFVFLGYGADSDTYAVLDAGHRLLGGGGYVPSRNPGYFLFETVAAALSRTGGSVLTNTATLAMAVVSVWCLLRIMRTFGVPHRHWACAACAFVPTFWINAHSTTDFLWALACLLAGWLALLDRRWLTAGLLLGLAVGFRLASGLPAGCLLAFSLLREPRPRLRVVAAGIVAAAFGAAWYVPSLIHSGWTFSFLHAQLGDARLWTPEMRLGRFLFKNTYLWGLPASILLLLSIMRIGRTLSAQRRSDRGPLIGLCVGVIVLMESLFLEYPIRQAYLLPLIPFSMILLAFAWEQRAALLAGFAAFVISLNFVNFAVARPDVPRKASTATLGFWVEPGQLVENVRQQWRMRAVHTLKEWNLADQMGALDGAGSRRAPSPPPLPQP